LRALTFAALLALSCAGLAQTQVTVAPASAGGVAEVLTLSGTLRAERSAGLSPRVDGLVSEVLVDAGDLVRAGQPLLRLDPALVEASLARATAETARAASERDEAARRLVEAQRLLGDKHVSATEVATRKAAVALAEASLRSVSAAEREVAELLRRHVLSAPFAGVIAAREAEAGEWVARSDAVLTLVALDAIRLDVQAPQERYAALGAAVDVEILPDTRPGSALPARIAARVPVGGGAGARTFLLRVVATSTDATLLPGTSASARFRLPQADASSVQVPRDALLRHPDGGYSVFVVEDVVVEGGTQRGLARRRPVRIGGEAELQVEILEGVRAGELVVVRGNEVLSDNAPVQLSSQVD